MDDYEYLMKVISCTLDILYKNEEYLFKNDSSERNMVFHFSRYLIENLKDTKYSGLDVDCEYNKNSLSKVGYKEIVYNYDNSRHRIFPDLLLHKRGMNNKNMLAIEFKKYNNYNFTSKKGDFYKLCALTSHKLEFKYKLGLFIRFGKTRDSVEIVKFINGNECV